MPSIAVYYKPSDDPATFEKRYLEEHVPMVDTWPGLKTRRFVKLTGTIAGDFPYAYVFVAEFETEEQIQALLASEDMKKAVSHAMEIAPNGFDAVMLDTLA